MMTIKWTAKALDDLSRLYEFLAPASRRAAANIVQALFFREVMFMSRTATKEKIVRDLTVSELKQIIHETIAEDIESWRATFEITSNKMLMSQIRGASKARKQVRDGDFIPWKQVRREV